MNIIGIIAEYNPFHKGHAHHINKIKEMHPDSIIILVLNGYFTQRGDLSILKKEDKVKISLDNNIDLVVEHPFYYSSNSADIFAESSIKILNHLGCTHVIFGSESSDIEKLTNSAKTQLKSDFNIKIKNYLEKGFSYPSSVSKALEGTLSTPNDLLGVAYIKSILANNFKIKPQSILRTNSYHDNDSYDEIVSASNIREKYKNNINVDKHTLYSKNFIKYDEDKLFSIIKAKIITEDNLEKYLSVDEGLEHKLKKEIVISNSLDELIHNVKSKRYTYSRIKRMLIHILIGLEKEEKEDINYIKVLGFNKIGQNHLKKIDKENILISRKIPDKYIQERYEKKASLIYDLITNENTYKYEKNNKPIIKNID